MKKFEIPESYRSPIISKVKAARKLQDPRKKDFTPTLLKFGNVEFLIARHFGFCYGVENAIEIAYKAVHTNPDKRIYLLSQMIHNPGVNEDLQSYGIEFIQDTHGKQLIPWESITSNDIVIIPAFGTTLEIEQKLTELGVDVKAYNTTCPFVEKVWNRSETLGQSNHTIIIHGKHDHEETRATFSHSNSNAPTLVIKNLDEAKKISAFITGTLTSEELTTYFTGKHSEGFNPEIDLQKIGVVNQTTMLASETQEITEFLRQTMITKYGEENIKNHIADTRDTLCYATNDNQSATLGLLEEEADLAIVVGGYNSLKKILKGCDYLTRDCMLNTIKDYFNQPNRLQFLDLNNDLGLEHIELEKSSTHLITLSALFKRGFTVQIYEKDDDGYWDEIDESTISFEDDESRKDPLLKTIHLYELVDGIMDRWENENQ
jgi:4-hydroxy-3-methylbut-2-enyl diphosphate reductase